MGRPRAVEPDDGGEERHPGVERVAGSGPAIDAVRIQRRVDGRELPVAAQYRRVQVGIRAAEVVTVVRRRPLAGFAREHVVVAQRLRNAGRDGLEGARRRRILSGVRSAVRIGSPCAAAPALREAPVGMGPLRLALSLGLIPRKRAHDGVDTVGIEVELKLVAVELSETNVVVREEVELSAGEISPLLVQ